MDVNKVRIRGVKVWLGSSSRPLFFLMIFEVEASMSHVRIYAFTRVGTDYVPSEWKLRFHAKIRCRDLVKVVAAWARLIEPNWAGQISRHALASCSGLGCFSGGTCFGGLQHLPALRIVCSSGCHFGLR